MVPHVIEPAEERVTKILRSFKEPIVSDVFARVVPDAFGRIQFRPVGREREHFHISAVRSEPVRDFRLGVIRGVVLKCVASHFRTNGKSSETWSCHPEAPFR